MALVPFAEKKLIRAGDNDPPIIPIGVILHVDAGNSADLYDYFKHRSGGIESHFHIRKDGHLYQYRNTGREADANLKANSFWKNGKRYGFISVETQGWGGGRWTADQLSTIKRLLLWAHEVHDVPLRVCRHPQDPGVGYHTLFGAPSAWTPVAKSCPGWRRKRQFRNVLRPWMASNPTQEDDMTSPKNWDREDWEAFDRHVHESPYLVNGMRHSYRRKMEAALSRIDRIEEIARELLRRGDTDPK